MKTIRTIALLSILAMAVTAGCSGPKGATGPQGPAGPSGPVSPPVAPGALALTPGPAIMITLSWQDNSTDEQGFEIERGTNGTNFITISTTPSNTAGYQDNGLTKGSPYFYRVRAFNEAGFSGYSNTASTLIAWVNTYGGISDEELYSIRQTTDGGYIAAGSTDSFGAGNADAWVLKFNSDGSVAWQKTYGGANADYTNAIQQTSDGGYIVAGYTNSFGTSSGDVWVMKLKSDGTVAWQKTYGGASFDSAYAVQQTSDGGYIVAGYTYSFGLGSEDVWVLKLTSDGTVTWQKTYGGVKSDRAYSIQQTSDGGYIVTGYTSSFGMGSNDVWVLKLNSDGTVAWQKTYGGIYNDFGSAIQQTSDGGYIAAGQTYSFGSGNAAAWVFKLNSDGTIAWQKIYGGTTSIDSANAIQQTSDGGYIVAGSIYALSSGKTSAWMLKLNSDGTVAWQKTYGGTNNDYLRAIRQTPDGGYIIAGSTDSFGAGSADAWVLRMPLDGFVSFKSSSGATAIVTGANSVNSSGTVNTTSVTPANSTATIGTSSPTVSASTAYIVEQAP